MKDKTLFIRIPDTHKKIIEEAAKREGRTVSSFVTKALINLIALETDEKG